MEGADGRFNVGVVAGSVGRTGAIRRGQLSGPYAAGAGVRAGAGRRCPCRWLRLVGRVLRSVRRQCRGGLGIEILEFRNCNPSPLKIP